MNDDKYCNDYGDAPGCLGVVDPRYTMRFGDAGTIYWCAACGPRANALNDSLMKWLQNPEDLKKFTEIVDKVTAERKDLQ